MLKSHALSFCGKLTSWRTSNSALRDKIYHIIIIGTGGFPIREQLRKDSGTAIESLGLIQASRYTAAVSLKDIKTIDLRYSMQSTGESPLRTCAMGEYRSKSTGFADGLLGEPFGPFQNV